MNVYLKNLVLCAFAILRASTVEAQKLRFSDADMVFHYSVMDAMRNGVYTGKLTVAEAGKKGNFGLGTYNQLDGELIALDGVFYRIASDGNVFRPAFNREIPFVSLIFFKPDTTFTLKGIGNLDALHEAISSKLPSHNKPYGIRITATFSEITTGGATKMAENDTTGIGELMKTRPVYKKENLSGTIIGFYNPAYISGVDLSPFHFHFISNDKSYGGHLISGQLASGTVITVGIDEKTGYYIVVPDQNKRFNKKWKPGPGANGTY